MGAQAAHAGAAAWPDPSPNQHSTPRDARCGQACTQAALPCQGAAPVLACSRSRSRSQSSSSRRSRFSSSFFSWCSYTWRDSTQLREGTAGNLVEFSLVQMRMHIGICLHATLHAALLLFSCHPTSTEPRGFCMPACPRSSPRSLRHRRQLPPGRRARCGKAMVEGEGSKISCQGVAAAGGQAWMSVLPCTVARATAEATGPGCVARDGFAGKLAGQRGGHRPRRGWVRGPSQPSHAGFNRLQARSDWHRWPHGWFVPLLVPAPNCRLRTELTSGACAPREGDQRDPWRQSIEKLKENIKARDGRRLHLQKISQQVHLPQQIPRHLVARWHGQAHAASRTG